MALIAALTLGCQSEANVQQPSSPAESRQTTTESRVLLDGTYQGKSVRGILVEVEVTVTSAHIADIQILEYKEISSIHAGKPTDEENESWETSKKAALETIPQRIIEKQSIKVDIVTPVPPCPARPLWLRWRTLWLRLQFNPAAKDRLTNAY